MTRCACGDPVRGDGAVCAACRGTDRYIARDDGKVECPECAGSEGYWEDVEDDGTEWVCCPKCGGEGSVYPEDLAPSDLPPVCKDSLLVDVTTHRIIETDALPDRAEAIAADAVGYSIAVSQGRKRDDGHVVLVNTALACTNTEDARIIVRALVSRGYNAHLLPAGVK